MNSGCQIIISD
ncbi:hypothetical protein EC902281_1880, partial [Escherichia coli 90.2281]